MFAVSLEAALASLAFEVLLSPLEAAGDDLWSGLFLASALAALAATVLRALAMASLTLCSRRGGLSDSLYRMEINCPVLSFRLGKIHEKTEEMT